MIFFVEDDSLVTCFERGVSEALVKEIAYLKPLRVDFRDAGFETDAVKINEEQIFRQVPLNTDVRSV